MSMLQVYEQILSEYAEMMQNIRRNEEISVNLADEIQKELLRMSEISARTVDLKDVYKTIQKKEEIMNDFSAENFDSKNISATKCHQLKENINLMSNILQEISNELQELALDENKSAE